MIYDYFCDNCDKSYEVIKSIKEYDGKDECETCHKVGRRIFSCNVYFTGTKVENAEFNIGLGKITKNSRHRQELAKRAGLVEVGNEKPETIHREMDRARSDKQKKAYDE